MELYTKTLHEIASDIKDKKVSIKEVLDSVYNRIESVEEEIGAYLTLTKQSAYNKAQQLQARLDMGEDIGELGGVPIAIKDNICMKNVKTTCASRMLDNFVSIYNATVIEKLEQAGAIIIGKTNMDEFAMGSSTETSYFKKTRNPYDLDYVPGGSSGGSAACIAANMAYGALGSDTGGSIRQPASYCGVVGLKPTYGLVSRYGLIAFASSLDQIGPFGKNVEDVAMLLNVISGHDVKDTTSAKIEKKDYTESLKNDIRGLKIAIPTSFVKEGINDQVKQIYNNAINTFKSLGAVIENIDLEYVKYSLATYYIIATAEASSNLGRYDGIRYGFRTNEFTNLEELYTKSRSQGFGNEVKRRIMLGTYVLSSGYYDAYYKRAQQVRTLIINEFKKIFESYDVILLPTAPNSAFKFGMHSNNPLEMYLEDIYTVPVNIAGLPAISLNGGYTKDNMPVGIQIISGAFEEEKLLQVAYAFEKNAQFEKIQPKI